MTATIITEKVYCSRAIAEYLRDSESIEFKEVEGVGLVSNTFVITHLNSTAIESKRLIEIDEKATVEEYHIIVRKDEMEQDGSLIYVNEESEEYGLLLNNDVVEKAALAVQKNRPIINACDPSRTGNVLFKYFVDRLDEEHEIFEFPLFSYQKDELKKAWEKLKDELKNYEG